MFTMWRREEWGAVVLLDLLVSGGGDNPICSGWIPDGADPCAMVSQQTIDEVMDSRSGSSSTAASARPHSLTFG